MRASRSSSASVSTTDRLDGSPSSTPLGSSSPLGASMPRVRSANPPSSAASSAAADRIVSSASTGNLGGSSAGGGSLTDSNKTNGAWEMEGLLTKKGHVRTNWKSRMFRLRGSRLVYFSGNRQKGAVELAGARVQPSTHHERSHCFEVQEAGSSGRRFLLSASSAESAAAWVAALRLRAASVPLPTTQPTTQPTPISADSSDAVLLSDDAPYDDDWAVLVLGDAGVGKTSLLLRFCMDQYVEPDPMGVRPPLNLSKMRTHKVVRVGAQTARLSILDTQGSEIFRTISTGKYNAAHGVVLVFAHGESTTLSRCEIWWREAQKYIHGGAPFLLAGNKADLTVSGDTRVRAQRFASVTDDMPYLDCSAATGENVGELFLTMARAIAKQRAPKTFG